MSSSSSSSSSFNSPCAACKFLRRKCMGGCVFAPYFPPEEPHKFANVHKIFGASNVTKLLNELLPHQREDAVNSLAYEAEARVRDPVYGCVGAISYLQRQVYKLQKELDAANADLIRFACTTHISGSAAMTVTTGPALQGIDQIPPFPPPPPPPLVPPPPPPVRRVDQFGELYQPSTDDHRNNPVGNGDFSSFPSLLPWSENIDPNGGSDRHRGNHIM